MGWRGFISLHWLNNKSIQPVLVSSSYLLRSMHIDGPIRRDLHST